MTWLVSAGAGAETSSAGGYSYSEKTIGAPDGRTSGARLACPGSRPVVGGGVDSNGGFENAMSIHSTRPFDGADSGRAEDDGWLGSVDRSDFRSESKAVTIYAICDSRRRSSAYSYTKRTATAAEGKQTTASVACPRGQPAISGGVASIGGHDERIWVHSSRPYDGPDADRNEDDGWRATVDNVGSTAEFGNRFTTYVICDRRRTRSAYRYTKKSVIAPEERQLRTDLPCATGSPAVGGGVHSSGGYDEKMFVNTSRPFDGTDADTAEDDGWRVAVDNGEGVVPESRGNRLTVYAICDR